MEVLGSREGCVVLSQHCSWCESEWCKSGEHTHGCKVVHDMHMYKPVCIKQEFLPVYVLALDLLASETKGISYITSSADVQFTCSNEGHSKPLLKQDAQEIQCPI